MRHLIHLFSRLVYFLISLVGREKRFAYAVKLSKIVTPFFVRVPFYRKPEFSLDTDREYVLAYMLNSMTFAGIEFDPKVTVAAEEFYKNEGVLMLTGHFYLNFLFCRWVYDRRIPMSMVMTTEKPQWFYSGTRVAHEVIPPTRKTLVQIKQRINEEKIVTIAIDNYFPYENWRRVETARKEIYISENIVHFAVKAKIPVIFFGTRLASNDAIVTEIVHPTEQTAEVIFEEFDRFLDRQLALRNMSAGQEISHE